jgi:streptogramin lyase
VFRNRAISVASRVFFLAAALAVTGCAPSAPFPYPSVSPTSLAFAASALGVSSPPQSVIVQNSGGQTLTIKSVTITGDFSANSSGCTSLTAGATCSIAITFTPTASGPRSGNLTVTTNAGFQVVSLSAVGIVPAVASLSATTLNFGNVTLSHASAVQSVTVTNTGGIGLSISNISITGDYAQTNNCSSTIVAGANCQISVTFTPTALGVRSGTLTIASNGTGSPQTVALTGSGVSGGLSFQVTVQAGSKPIAGASVQIYAPGTSGNGSAATGLLSPLATTNANGVATIPTTYNCLASSPLVYAVSTGGTVAGTSSANANLALMSALGTCSSISSGAKFVVDEATTVAAVEALAPFYALGTTPGGSVGATSTNSLGLANAFATAATLADSVAGTSPGSALPANAVSPAARVNSLANLLNACALSVSACSPFYSSVAPGTTLPTNTLDALYDLVKNPGHNVAALYTLSLAGTAYTPVLAAKPTDWSMFINYAGGGMDSPSGIGVDSRGNVWVASYFNTASKFTTTGAAVFPTGITGSGLNNSYGMAIDLNDNVWIANEQPFTSVGIGSVSEFTSSGISLAGNGYINGGMDYPLSIAIDPNGTVWVLDFGDSYLTLLNPSGTPISGTNGYTSAAFAFPVAVAVDSNHFGWVVNQSSSNVTKVAPDGSSFTNYNCCDGASGVAIDQGNNVWIANYFGDSVSLVSNSGTVIANNYTAGGSIYHPQGIAVDGAGTVWVANYRAPYLSELAGSTSAVPGTALSPPGGLGADAGLLEAYALALDASGNVWVSNQGSNLVTKYIGLATPVKTPLSGLPKLP